jgi:hypothetical protein
MLELLLQLILAEVAEVLAHILPQVAMADQVS